MKADNKSILELPTPEPPAKKGRGGLFLFFTALVLGAAGSFWFTRPPEVRTNIIETSREAFRKSIESGSVEPFIESMRRNLVPEVYSFAGDVSEVVSGALTEAVSAFNSLRQPQAPPPEGPSIPVLPSQPGTLSGRDIQASVTPLAEPAPAGADLEQPEVVSGTVAPRVKEDSVVRPIFVEDMAQWLVSRYRPGKGGGSVSIGVQAANMRYGAGMHGLASGDDLIGARGSLLRYAFNAPMLDALYNLYIDHFMEALGEAASAPKSGPVLTSAQIDEMYRLYSARFSSVAATMNGIAGMPDLQKRLHDLDVFSQKSVEAHRVLNEAVFELDEARKAGNETAEKTAQMRVDGNNARYRKALADHAAAQNALIQAIKKGASGNALDDDSILFLAFWLDRRLEKQEGASAALAKAGALLDDLSRRLARAADIAR